MKRQLLTLAFVLFAVSALAQSTATPANKFAFDQAAPNLADAQGYTYKYYADGAAAGVVLSGVACTGTASPFVCQVPVPAFTPGNHTIQLTASNIAGESAKSASFAFTMVVTPTAPANIRLQ